MTCDICGAYLGPAPTCASDVFDLIGEAIECSCKKFVVLFVCYRLASAGHALWLEPLVVRFLFGNGLAFRTMQLAPWRSSTAEVPVGVLKQPVSPSAVTRAVLTAPSSPTPITYDKLCETIAAGRSAKALLMLT